MVFCDLRLSPAFSGLIHVVTFLGAFCHFHGRIIFQGTEKPHCFSNSSVDGLLGFPPVGNPLPMGNAAINIPVQVSHLGLHVGLKLLGQGVTVF